MLVAALVVLFVVLFVAIWCGVSLLLSAIGGWGRLAQAYPASAATPGTRYLMQHAHVGAVSYRGCLTIYVSDEGLRLSVWPLFRLGHAPLFIPWDAIHSVEESQILWLKNVSMDIGTPSITTLRLAKHVLEGTPILVNTKT